MTSAQRWATAKEVAEVVKKDPRTVRRWAIDGVVKVRRLPLRGYLIAVDEDGWPIEP